MLGMIPGTGWHAIKTGVSSMRQDNARSTRPVSTLGFVHLPFLAAILVAGHVEASEEPLIESSRSSTGCGQEAIGSGVYTMMHDGNERIYRVHVPAGYKTDVAAPVVAFFHGWGGNEDEFAANEMVTEEADRRGYILIAPRGIGSGDPDHKANSWTFSGSATGLDGDGANSRVDGDTDAICDHGMTQDYSYGSCAASKSNTCSWTHCQADGRIARLMMSILRLAWCKRSRQGFVWMPAGYSRWVVPMVECIPGNSGKIL